MSYTQFIGDARCSIKNYNEPDSILDPIALKIVNEIELLPDDVRWEFDQCSFSECKETLERYIEVCDGDIRILCDTEDSNSNSMVWDYLIQEICKFMTSDLMTVTSTSIDSRDGVSSSTDFYNRQGKWVDITEASNLKNKNKIISVREQIQEDIQTYFGDGLKDEIIDRLCQIVVDNFKQLID